MKSDQKATCLNEQEMMQYIRGRSDKAEQRRVELHISDCELCADALEGLKLVNADHSEIVTALRHKLNQKIITKKPATLSFEWWQIAALFAIIAIGAGTYIYITTFSQENNVISAIKTEKEKTSEEENTVVPVPVEEQSDVVEQRSSTAAERIELRKEDLPAPATDYTVQENKVQDLTGEADMVASMPAEAEQEETASEVIVSQEVQSAKDAPARTETGVVSKHEKASVPQMKQIKGNVAIHSDSAGISLYNKGLFAEAVEQLKLAPATDQRDYYLAVSYFEQRKHKDALYYFEEVLLNKNSRYYDSALWHKAQILFETKNAKSRKVLQEIVNSNSPHSNEAQKLLDSLK